MTLKELQEYLDLEKWKDSERNACDMCGRYARCRYCDRGADDPCARAHNRLEAALRSDYPDLIPDWLIAEPAAVAGTVASDEISPENAAMRRKTAGTAGAAPDLPAEGASDAEERGSAFRAPAGFCGGRRIVVRAQKKDVRLFVLHKKLPTISALLGFEEGSDD